MKYSLVTYLISLLLLNSCSAALPVQEDSTTIIINGNSKVRPNSILIIKIDAFSKQVTINNEGKAKLTIPKLLMGKQVIAILQQNTYQQIVNAWSSIFELNGSGYFIYTLAEDGKGVASQWPAVTWVSKQSRLDIYLNGNSKGSTQLTRGIEPERKHRFTWKRNNTVICDTTVSLPFNVKRTCICDEQSRKVSIQ